jgi:hypothetical protein
VTRKLGKIPEPDAATGPNTGAGTRLHPPAFGGITTT